MFPKIYQKKSKKIIFLQSVEKDKNVFPLFCFRYVEKFFYVAVHYNKIAIIDFRAL